MVMARLKEEHPASWIKVPVDNRRSIRFIKSWYRYQDAYYPILKDNEWLEFDAIPEEFVKKTASPKVVEEPVQEEAAVVKLVEKKKLKIKEDE